MFDYFEKLAVSSVLLPGEGEFLCRFEWLFYFRYLIFTLFLIISIVIRPPPSQFCCVLIDSFVFRTFCVPKYMIIHVFSA